MAFGVWLAFSARGQDNWSDLTKRFCEHSDGFNRLAPIYYVVEK